MNKLPNNPFLINELPALSMTGWKQFGFLNGGYCRKSVRWLNASPLPLGEAIEIIIDTRRPLPSIRFLYSLEGNNVDYQIPLIQKKTNTGLGLTWYISPEPGMFCRKIYFYEGRFRGRKQIEGALYRSQVLSGERQRADKLKSRIKKLNQILKRQEDRYYKSKYAKKWTKHHLKVLSAHGEIDRLTKLL